MSLKKVNEKTTPRLKVSFFDDQDPPAAVTPLTATYRVDDEKSRTNIVAATSITGLAKVIYLKLTVAATTISNDDNEFENRIVTVDFTFNDDAGVARRGTSEYKFMVLNLLGVS
jgi:hypothetical protein